MVDLYESLAAAQGRAGLVRALEHGREIPLIGPGFGGLRQDVGDEKRGGTAQRMSAIYRHERQDRHLGEESAYLSRCLGDDDRDDGMTATGVPDRDRHAGTPIGKGSVTVMTVMTME
jgi:hypothetical protein